MRTTWIGIAAFLMLLSCRTDEPVSPNQAGGGYPVPSGSGGSSPSDASVTPQPDVDQVRGDEQGNRPDAARASDGGVQADTGATTDSSSNVQPDAGQGNVQPDAGQGTRDLEWANGPLPPESPTNYTIGTNTVVDNVTGLEWERKVDTNLFTSLPNATNYCANLVLDGKSDWRVPTVIEMLSIVDSDKKDRADPAINVTAFPNTPRVFHWISTPAVAVRTPYVWCIHFDYGNLVTHCESPVGSAGAIREYVVRCVRVH